MSVSIVRDKTYPYTPEQVWHALTDPKLLAAWLMENDFAPVVGHRFQFRAKPVPGWRGVVDCEVLEVDEPRRLVYSWVGLEDGSVTTVTYTLEPVEGGTRLRFEHTGLTEEMRAGMEQGDHWMLEVRLPAVLAGLSAGPGTCHADNQGA